MTSQLGAVFAGGPNPGHRRRADAAQQRLSQVLHIIGRNCQDPREPLSLPATARMTELERVASELLVDAVRILGTGEELPDFSWPGHRSIVP